MRKTVLRVAAGASALMLLMGAQGCDGFKANQDVADASSAIKGALCSAGVALAASAAEKRGVPVGDLISTPALVKGCQSLADRLPVSATVYDTGIAAACAKFDVVATRLSDPDELASLASIQRDAGC